MYSRICVASLIIALGGACLGAEPAMEEPFRIVAASYPVYLMASAVAGNIPGVDVSCLRPAAPAERDDTLSPGASSNLDRADVLVAHGAGIELSLDETAIRYPKLPIVETAEGIARPGEEDEHLPWIWMSVSDTIREVRALRRALERIDRQRRERYALNAERYVARLELLRDRMKGAFDPYRGVKAAALDGASARFAREAGLDVVTAASPEEAIAVVKATDAQAVLVSPRVPAEAARMIARETRRPVCVIDPVAGGPDRPGAYLAIMAENLRSLRAALRHRTATRSPSE